jgi:PPK2 family polyphosphate:nucleotide phosphotransferase
VRDAPTAAPAGAAVGEGELAAIVEELGRLQRRLYASDDHAILLVFQAMDAAGKDGTIRALLTGVDPAGCQVTSFKQPSAEELDHDFLWRTTRALPERGRIGVFNRSHYEEVLVVRVHPEYLDRQRLPNRPPGERLWKHRFGSIRRYERHLARNGVVVVKFWLNVSKEEQRQRFLSRIDDPDKNWKFQPGDVDERALWDEYMQAYEQALNATSRPGAPWYAIPADDKAYMRREVARIVLETLRRVDPQYPKLGRAERARLAVLKERLEADV